MKDELVGPNLHGPFATLGIGHEWGTFMFNFMANYDVIKGLCEDRHELLSTRETRVGRLQRMPLDPNIIEAFGAIPRENFPALWRSVVRLLTIMPTTVSCEQSFSYFKRTLHANMSEQTARNFLFSRLSLQ